MYRGVKTLTAKISQRLLLIHSIDDDGMSIYDDTEGIMGLDGVHCAYKWSASRACSLPESH